MSKRARRSKRRVRFFLEDVMLRVWILTISTGWKRVVTKVGFTGQPNLAVMMLIPVSAYLCRARLHQTAGQIRT